MSSSSIRPARFDVVVARRFLGGVSALILILAGITDVGPFPARFQTQHIARLRAPLEVRARVVGWPAARYAIAAEVAIAFARGHQFAVVLLTNPDILARR